MDTKLLERIIDSSGAVEVNQLKQPRHFSQAADAPDGTRLSLRCQQETLMDVDLHIRHGSSLKLRNTRWLVSNQRVPEPLLGRPMLEVLGLNTADILATAADRSAGVVDAQHLASFETHIGEGRVSRVLEGYLPHRRRQRRCRRRRRT